MIHRLVQVFVLFPVAVILVVFAVANRHPVTISLDPFMREAPALAFAVPVFVMLFATLLLGVAIGGVAAWMRQGKWRKRARREHHDAVAWRRRAEEAAAASTASDVRSLPAARRAS